MKETEAITQISDKLLAVPVPQDAKDFYIDYNCELRFQSKHDWRGIVLPDIDYSILGLVTPKEIGFDCSLLVANNLHLTTDGYGLYKNYNKEYCYEFEDPTDSFRSLLQSKGLDSGHYLIIEKI